MDCNTPGFPILHYLSEFAQTHVYWVSDAIQLSHSLLPSSPPVLSQGQPGSGSFPMSWLFPSGDHNIGTSASASVLPKNIQDRFPLGVTGLVSLIFKGLSGVFSRSSPAPQFESINPSALSLLYSTTLISVHDYWKNHSFDYTDLCWKVISLLFNTLSRFNLRQSFVSFYFLHI